MPKATLTCPRCGHTARRELLDAAGCRGHRETPTELATCPRCRVEMDRPEDHLRASAYNVDVATSPTKCHLCRVSGGTHYCTSLRRVITVDIAPQSR